MSAWAWFAPPVGPQGCGLALGSVGDWLGMASVKLSLFSCAVLASTLLLGAVVSAGVLPTLRTKIYPTERRGGFLFTGGSSTLIILTLRRGWEEGDGDTWIKSKVVANLLGHHSVCLVIGNAIGWVVLVDPV